MPLTCQQLLNKYPNQWQAATVHPFLAECQQGTIQPAQFNTWLVQDYHFVLEFTRFAASVIQSAPSDHLDILLGGMVALKDELNWFKAKAAERQLNLTQPLQPSCETYCQFMTELAQQPYSIKAVGFWAIELAYNQGWQGHSPMPEPYTEFADRWGNADFTTYVDLLSQQADSALQDTDETVQSEAETVFLTTASLEKDFWQMAYEGGASDTILP